MMDAETKAKVEARLKRAAGQVAGVQRMVEGDRYCVDVLAKVSRILLESHIETCVSTALASDDPAQREAKIEELVRIFDRNCNC